MMNIFHQKKKGWEVCFLDRLLVNWFSWKLDIGKKIAGFKLVIQSDGNPWTNILFMFSVFVVNFVSVIFFVFFAITVKSDQVFWFSKSDLRLTPLDLNPEKLVTPRVHFN